VLRIQNDQIAAMIRSINESLSLFPDISIAVLFGSAVTNRMRADSDVDIAIAGESALSWDRIQEIRIAIGKVLRREIDIVDLQTSKGLIFYEALTKGTIVFSRNRRLMAKMMTEAVYFGEDFLPLMKRALENKARKFIYG